MPPWATGRRRALADRGARRVWLWLIAALGLVIAAYLGTPEPRLADGSGQLVGAVDRVIDGDTLDLAGQRIRLAGIDAPERHQTCGAASGARWSCGDAARIRLTELLRGKLLTCRAQNYDRYGRLVAHCEMGKHDPAGQLVREGLALATEGYAFEQADAMLHHAGLWQGPFERPADWRRRQGAGSEESSSPSRFERFLAWLFRLLGS